MSESVWDYPRPPRIEPCSRRVRVLLDGVTVVDTIESFRVLETSLPPVVLHRSGRRCSRVRSSPPAAAPPSASGRAWRATSTSWQARARAERAAWAYHDPYPGFEAIRDAVGFYPWAVEAFVDDERVQAQEGGFYGGWITSDLIGPFKGAPGTAGW